ncbi:hypothetical protein GCM10027398_00470 [Azotobacter salinestris]
MRSKRQLSAEQALDQPGRLAGDLALGQRPEVQHLHAPGQGIGDLRQQQHIGRPRQQETSRRALTVHGRLDRQENPGGALHFIEADRPLQRIDEAEGVGLHGRQDRRIVKGVVRGLPAKILDQRALAGLAGAIDQHDGSLLERFEKEWADAAQIHGVISST